MSDSDTPNIDENKFIPRRPVRGPGIIRYKELIDATEALLSVNPPETVGIYQIAEFAKAPIASAYHFFPTKDAAFLALMERYVINFIEISALPVDLIDIEDWQSLITLELKRASEFYISHPAAMKIFYGGYSSEALLMSDREFQLSISHALKSRLETVFHMPEIDNIEIILHSCIVMMDAIWSLSHHLHKTITEYFFQESCKALLTYLELYIPKKVEFRDEVMQAKINNEKLTLPPYGPIE